MLPPRCPPAVWLTLALLLATKAMAATFLAEGYAVRVWQTQDGLPQNMVTSAVQTRDGYLWFGTYNGLARFNGERFQVFDSANTPDIHDRRISSLYEDEQGTLWIGHESGLITRRREGAFERFTAAAGAMGDKVIGLGNDRSGRLWAMRENGALESLLDGRRVPSLIAPDLPNVMAWSRSANGHIWVGENGRAAALSGDGLAVAALGSHETSAYVMGLAASTDGGVWLLRDGRVRKWAAGRWADDLGPAPWPEGPVACARELRDGSLAVGTIYSGLYLIFRDGRRPVHFDRGIGLPQNWVRFVEEDREGNLWVGTGTAGLASIHATPFSVLNAPDDWQGCTVLAVAAGRDGSLWIGTDGATLYHHANGVWRHYGKDEGLTNPYVPAVALTSDDRVWAGAFWWGSPYRMEGDRFIRPPGVEERASPVFALLPGTSPDELLVGNRDGLLRLKGGRATWLVKAPDSTTGAVVAIAREPQGGIWCGFSEGGLARLVGEQLQFFRRQDGLPSDSVECLRIDDGGVLWIGTADGGLSRFKDGRFANLGVAQGLVDKSVSYILDDGRGYFWLGTHRGPQRIAKEHLNQCADGAITRFPSQTYDQHDGLPTLDLTGGLQSAACQTPDGRLWFTSSKGVLSVDPSRVAPNPVVPPVVFEALHVDGQPIAVTDSVVPGVLPPDHQRLEFAYSGLSFVAPNKVLFKYRLEGIDRDWIDAGPKRTASYSRLPAGEYRFRVVACNNDGVWNLHGASVAFTVAPFFWQTWWFVTANLLAAAGAVAWLARFVTRRRMQRQIEQMERRHELERERARIAQDIHDDVGASLSRIAMLSQPAGSDIAQPERTAAMLTRIYTTAREVTRSLDEIVWAVDPRHDTLESLVDYMGKYAQSYLTPSGLRCRLDLPVDVPAWPLTAEVRHNLFLAFKEALNNAAKHAQATEVRISFRLLADAFALTVTDNGRGLDAPRLRAADRVATGRGLANMQERLARIGGHCEIASAPDGGARVTFTVTVDTPAEAPPVPPLV